MRSLSLLAAASLAAVSVPVAAQDRNAAAMTAEQNRSAMRGALDAANRAEDRARDTERHPAETLAFFGVEPGMTVVDYMPASGWYTRVLVPYLGESGRYIGLTPDPAAADGERFANYFAGLPGSFTEASPGWSLSGAPTAIYGSQEVPEELKGNVDRVLIFREMHNLLRSGVFYTELSRIRNLLADDGMLGIVQHRAPADAPGAYTLGNNGYLRQQDVIALVEAMGFDLVGMSDVNANPEDPANWEGGVWNLPPSFSGADEGTPERARRAAIGESDRMTLLFKKRA